MSPPPPHDDRVSSATASTAPSSALCLGCGAGRRLALARCDACGHVPTTSEDRAAHILAMELGAREREALAAHIRGGGRFEPDPDELAEAQRDVEAAGPLAVGAFAMVVGGLPFLLVGGVLFLLAWAMLAL